MNYIWFWMAKPIAAAVLVLMLFLMFVLVICGTLAWATVRDLWRKWR